MESFRRRKMRAVPLQLGRKLDIFVVLGILNLFGESEFGEEPNARSIN